MIYLLPSHSRGLQLRVVANKVLHFSVTPPGVEVVCLHLCIHLIKVPMIMVEAIDRAHHPRAMAATCAMNKKLSGRRIVNESQKLADLFSFRIIRVAHWNVNVAHPQR